MSAAAAGFVWDPRLASHVYRSDHPLKPWRLQGVHDTLERLGAFALPNARLLEPRLATRAELGRIHDPAYIDAIAQASEDPELDYSEWGLSAYGDTPPFAGMHEASLLTTGASLTAMEDVIAGRSRVAFNGAGGLHHAMRRNASGFCIYNDPAVVCGLLADRGMKVAYVDIDAHHGDGVQFAFYTDPRVLTISSHERGDRLFPGTGFVEEMGEGAGLGYSVNLPLQPYTDDAVYEPAFEAVVPPLLRAFEPDVVVLQLGIDSHRTDPLTHLAWTVQGFTKIVTRLLELSPRVVALGGGGYDLPNVARAWTAAWAAMNGVELPAEIPRASQKDLSAHGLKSMRLWDPPLELPADTRQWAEDYAMRQVKAIREHIFPLHGL